MLEQTFLTLMMVDMTMMGQLRMTAQGSRGKGRADVEFYHLPIVAISWLASVHMSVALERMMGCFMFSIFMPLPSLLLLPSAENGGWREKIRGLRGKMAGDSQKVQRPRRPQKLNIVRRRDLSWFSIS